MFVPAMEVQVFNVIDLRSSCSSFINFISIGRVPCTVVQREGSSRLCVKSKKGNAEIVKGLQRESKAKLSHILRTEAAVKAIERKAKAKSAKFTHLCPKVVLEALEDSIRKNQWESALENFGLLRKQQWYQPRCQTYTKLLVMLGKCRQPGQARMLFEKMLVEGIKPTVDVYTSLVSAYGLNGFLDEAFCTVEEMKSFSDCKPDIYTYSILINCCVKHRRFDLIDLVLSEMSYLGIDRNTVMYNTLIDGYGKAEMFELMENSFSDMLETQGCHPDVFTLNSFLWAYGNAGMIEKMEKWYEEFQHMRLAPDIKTFNILIRSYGKAGMYDKMHAVVKFMEKRFFTPTIVTYNTIIDMLGKAGNIDKMEHFFRTMKYKGLKPNSITYCSLVTAYTRAGQRKKIWSIIRQIGNSDVVLDTPFFNSVFSAFGQAGDLKMMEQIFFEMKERKCKPDNITFAIFSQAYGAHGVVESTQDLELKIGHTKNS
ncbi:hypothetical protein Scep_006262 [Stephania cephalantha]|uniref:Pentatricopeptide repeat-containing protein n=1 Tax=Stephania cephalantha TaxID=152367 RepID=A0AAP0PMU9_9MAGN